MKENTFIAPHSSIYCGFDVQDVIDTFQCSYPSYRVCMITDEKNVSLASIAKEFAQKKDWIVIRLDPLHDLIKDMAAALSDRNDAEKIFEDAGINLSFLGLGKEIDGVYPITDIFVALGKMLDALTKKNKKILVTIDDVISNENVQVFVLQFQIFMRRKYNIFLLMAGSHENIQRLQDEKSLTFLYRAPKVILRS